MAHVKRSIIEAKAETDCLAHALVIAIARLTNDPNYKAYSQGNKIRPVVQHLLQSAGINLENGGWVPELQRFQDHFSEYKIVVYGGLNCGDIIFEGKVASEKRVNLLYDDVTRHFHVIANLTGAMSKQYICAGCRKSCDSGVTHKCSEACKDCMFIPPCISTHVRIPCGSCNRTFGSQACFEKHTKNKLKGKPVCMQKRNCAK